MTVDKSLRMRKGIVRARNVLTRAERIEKLSQQDRWSEEDGPCGLPKVRVYGLSSRRRKRKRVKKKATPQQLQPSPQKHLPQKHPPRRKNSDVGKGRTIWNLGQAKP